jgi:hypothetical protein
MCIIIFSLLVVCQPLPYWNVLIYLLTRHFHSVAGSNQFAVRHRLLMKACCTALQLKELNLRKYNATNLLQ